MKEARSADSTTTIFSQTSGVLELQQYIRTLTMAVDCSFPLLCSVALEYHSKNYTRCTY